MNDYLLVLKAMKEEMNSQEHDSQAHPRFWVVGDYSWVECSEDNSERVRYYFPGDCECYTEEEIIEKAKEDGYPKSYIDDLEFEHEYGGYYDFHSRVSEAYEDVYPVYERERHIIKENTMFLSKQEAQIHIKQNQHHYTNRAHTYAMTAWRAPRTQKVIEAIMSVDWDRVIEWNDSNLHL